jgi:Permeases of the major facilitator superfamily
MLARMIPEGREGEIFGLYATTGRAVSFVSPMFYGLAITIGGAVVGDSADATYWGILGIALVLLIGFFLLLPVKAKKMNANGIDGDAPLEAASL